jgi:CheY-like chemotaxis protein
VTDSLIKRTVLIVDDDESTRETLAQVLDAHGYQSSLADNGQQAIDWLEMNIRPPKLILLDLEMPVMNGREFLFRLQMLQGSAKPEVIVISGQDSQAVPGAFAVLRKPIAVSQLLGLMQLLMPLPERPNGSGS